MEFYTDSRGIKQEVEDKLDNMCLKCENKYSKSKDPKNPDPCDTCNRAEWLSDNYRKRVD